MPTDRVLIEIVTAAHMAGIEQAQAGFLGLTPQIALAGVALAGLVFVGKSAVENYEKQEKASKDLGQAIKSFNDQYGETTQASEKAQAALASAQDAASKAQDTLTIATNAVTKAELAYSDAVDKHGRTSEQAYKASLNLQDAQIRLKEAQDAVTDSQTKVTAAQVAAQPTTQRSIIYADSLVKEFNAWTQTNKQYIPDQYKAEAALASFIRAGENAPTSMRLLNDALDLSTLKTEGMDEASRTLLLALNGNSRGLRDLGITTTEYKNIMDGTGTTQQKQIELLTLIETKTKDGRKATTDLEQAQNKLNKDWQDFTARIGPAVVTGLADIIDAFDTLLSGTSPGQRPGVVGGRFGGIRQRQHGGPVYAGTSYLVGERGPELFSPGQSGTITPNGGGSPGPAIHIHVDRGAFIDGPSTDRLANIIAQRLSYVTGR